MATRIFGSPASRKLVTGGISVAVLAYGAKGAVTYHDAGPKFSPAEEQFTTASKFPTPTDWQGPVFRLRYDYPPQAPQQATSETTAKLPPMPGPERPLPGAGPDSDAPWLKIDFKSDPIGYSNIIKEYCWEGNVINDFDVWKNTVSTFGFLSLLP